MSDIIARVRALLERTVQQGATEAEAAAAAQAVERILARHSLTMDEVLAAPIAGRPSRLRYLEPWVRNMGVQCARYYGCEPYITYVRYTRRGRAGRPDTVDHYRTLVFYGREDATAVAVEMACYLYDTVIRLSRDFSGARAEQLAFQRGAGEKLADRLWSLRLEQESHAQQPAGVSDGTALVVQQKSEAKNWVEKNLESVKKTLRESNLDSDAAWHGAAAAMQIPLTTQVGAAGAPPAARIAPPAPTAPAAT